MTADPDHKWLQWWTNLRSPEAGIWLDTPPNCTKYTLISSAFRTCLQFRYLMGASQFPSQLRCDTLHPIPTLRGRVMDYPTIDREGLHLVHGCRAGQRTQVHTGICIETDSLLRYAGLWSTRELKAFRRFNPNNNNRPDVTISNVGGLQHVPPEVTEIHIDVAITSTLTGSESCQIRGEANSFNAKMKGRQADERYKDKMRHYNKILRDARLANPAAVTGVLPKIVPLIFESTGLIHPLSLKFLKDVSNLADRSVKIGPEKMYRHFLKRLSFSFQRGIASAINNRGTYLLRRQVNLQQDPSVSLQVLVEDSFR